MNTRELAELADLLDMNPRPRRMAGLAQASTWRTLTDNLLSIVPGEETKAPEGAQATAPRSRKRIGIVILGMGRSGTSAIAGMLVRAGFFAGREDDVLPADPDNERGHHENLGVLNRNEETILGLGGYWYLPPAIDAQLSAAPRVEPLLRGEIQRLAREAAGRPIVVKDPRIGAMLPIWRPIIEDHFCPVLVTRHPLDVARSLQKREGTPIPNGLAIWETYMTFMLGCIRGWRVTVVPYVNVLENPAIAEQLVFELAGRVDPVLARRVVPAAAAEALDPSLRHNRHTDSDVQELMTGRQQSLWAVVSRMQHGEQMVDVPASLSQPTESARSIVADELYRLGIEHERRQSAARESDYASCRQREQDLLGELSALEQRYSLVINSRRWRAATLAARVLQAALSRFRSQPPPQEF